MARPSVAFRFRADWPASVWFSGPPARYDLRSGDSPAIASSEFAACSSSGCYSPGLSSDFRAP
eukprot:4545382-Alexandrium_andersonii.AAC.1